MTFVQNARCSWWYAPCCVASLLTATKLHHLRQTPLAPHRHREIRENIVRCTLMLCKVFLDGAKSGTLRTRNLFFFFFFFAASFPARALSRHREISFYTVEGIARCKKCFRYRVHARLGDTDRTNEKFSLSVFYYRGSASRMYVREEAMKRRVAS